MTTLLIPLGIFIVSVAALVWSSDKFIDSADSIGKFLKLPSFIIGVILVGIGTSLPELVTSIVATMHGASEIVVGNVFGSNITNIFLVFGVTALFFTRFDIKHDVMRTDLPFLVLSTGFIVIAVSDFQFSLGEGLICLLMLIMYLYRSLKDGNLAELIEEKAHTPTVFDWILIVITPIGIYFSSTYVISSITEIAAILSIGTEVLAVTVVALGTSLPELMVTIQAGRKGENEIAVGNVLGSNVFNILAVMGLPSLISPLVIPQSIVSFTVPVLLLATFVFVIIAQSKKVYRIYGFLFIVIYVYFIAKQYGAI